MITVGKITGLTRLNSSMYGNPKYEVWFIDEKSNTIHAKTADNAMCAYGIRDHKEWCKITWHITRKGNNIIDYIE